MSSKFILYFALIAFEALLILNYFSSELIGICSVAAFILIYCCIDIYNCLNHLEKNDRSKKEKPTERAKLALTVLLISILFALLIAVDKINANGNEENSAAHICDKTEINIKIKTNQHNSLGVNTK